MSAYAAFDVLIEDADGLTAPAALATVHVYEVATGDELLPFLVADADGHVAAGTLPVGVGAAIRFQVDLDAGLVGFAEIVTS